MTKRGYSFGLVGAPKSGKSHACRSLDALPGYKYAFVAPPGEVVAYDGTSIVAEPYYDDEWHPSEKSFKSTGYAKMMAKLKELEGMKELGAVVFDTVNNGASDLIWQFVMSGYNTDDPRTLGGNSLQPYTTYKSRLKELLQRLDILRVKTGAHIVLTFHEDVREDEGRGTPRRETGFDKNKLETHWDIGRLPVIYGSMRQDIMGWPDCAFFCQPVLGSNPYRCQLIAFPDSTRAAGTRLPIMKQLQAMKEVPNDLAAIVRMADGATTR